MTAEVPFTDDQIALAASNYELQEALFVHLRRAFEMSGLGIDGLAEELEITVEEAQAWIDGETDLRLAEVRHLANAIDAQVAYRVSPIRTTYGERFQRLADAANLPWQRTSRVWSTDPDPAPVMAQ